MLITALQRSLADLNDTPVEYAIHDFLITDRKLARTLQEPATLRENDERLLVRESAEGLDLSLFIDGELLAGLERSDPLRRLGNNNLNALLVALEGVSHFNYLVWNAARGKSVTQLELELQAEVDKFVVVSRLFREQGRPTEDFHQRLFEDVRFDPDCDTDEGQRYRDANRYAGKYCRRLEQRFSAPSHHPSFLNEIRRFYRLAQHQKIRAIEQRPA